MLTGPSWVLPTSEKLVQQVKSLAVSFAAELDPEQHSDPLCVALHWQQHREPLGGRQIASGDGTLFSTLGTVATRSF